MYLTAKPGRASQPCPAFTFLGRFYVIHGAQMGPIRPRFIFFIKAWQHVRVLFI